MTEVVAAVGVMKLHQTCALCGNSIGGAKLLRFAPPSWSSGRQIVGCGGIMWCTIGRVYAQIWWIKEKGGRGEGVKRETTEMAEAIVD